VDLVLLLVVFVFVGMWLLDLCRPVSPRRKHFANIWKQAVSLMLLLKALNFLSLCLSVFVCVSLCVPVRDFPIKGIWIILHYTEMWWLGCSAGGSL
jgi:hypothetical protein